MKREESKYCEECKHCNLIENYNNYCIMVHCSKRTERFDDPVVYCNYKKLKKEKKKKC